MLVFDASRGDGRTTELGTAFSLVSDRVMGGVSIGQMSVAEVSGRRALRMTGDVSLENKGGFLQMAVDLALDAAGASALRIEVLGNDETYGCHLRTTDVVRPWQSYRQSFLASKVWRTIELPIQHFLPHRLEVPFRPDQIRRLGLVAIGRAFRADLAVARVELI